MTSPQYWFIDFDETLATGSLTWAQEFAFPKLIQDYGLTENQSLLDQALLVAQEESSRDHDPRRILDELFVTMSWPPELAKVLMTDILSNYQPRLFDDALALLHRLRQAERHAIVISNNPLSSKYTGLLGIDDLIDAVYTPRMLSDVRPKPHRDVWDVIVGLHPEITADNAAIVGDDPWADGEFALNCGVRCYLVDRSQRFTTQSARFAAQWVQSLDEIVL